YLLRSNPVSYAASATVLQRQSQSSTLNQSTEALAFCPFTKKLAGKSVAALPFSVAEVAALESLYPTLTQDQRQASRLALLEAVNDKKIVHLSTHAYATAEGKEQPRILTATEPVYLPDIYGLQLDSKLVTLSACQSNIGPLAKGEGVLSLGRAFTSAGAQGVVASLWSLNDRATADITSSFYQKLAKGHPKPLALHEAQLAYLDREDLPAYLKSPYYWAGLTYYGDAGTLTADSFLPWWTWLLTIVGLFGLLFFLRGRRPASR
ncbi:MAG: CHAT domain-containing protein, partial [Bacteroidota bacterium]